MKRRGTLYTDSDVTRLLKEQRDICAIETEDWWEKANSMIGGTMGKYPNGLDNGIRHAPEPKI